MKINFLLLFSFLLTTVAIAQNQEEDRKEINNVIAKLYKSISFINGEGADEETLKSIHYEGSVIGAVDTSKVQIFTEVEFRKRNREAFKKNNVRSFQEKELSHITHVYGGVAMRFSTYEFEIKLVDRELKVKGINTFQLIKDPKKGWLIYSNIFSDTMSYPEVPEIYMSE